MSEEKYNKLISNIDLKKVELVNLQSNTNKTFAYNQKKLEIALRYNISDEIDQNGIEITIPIYYEVFPFVNDNNIDSSDISEKELDEEKILFKVSFTLDLIYEVEINENDKDLSHFNEELNKFAERNVPVNAWPYARELISSITTRMGYPPLLIPTFKNLPKN